MPILTDDLMNAAEPLIGTIQHIEYTLTMNATEQLASFKKQLAKIADDPDKLNKLRKTMLRSGKQLHRLNQSFVRGQAPKLLKEMDDAVMDVVTEHVLANDAVYDEPKAIALGTFNTDVPAPMSDPAVLKAAESVITSANVYISDSLNIMINSTGTAYLAATNQIINKMVVGGTLNVALKQALNNHIASGVGALVDSAGRTWSPTAYYEMLIRTTTKDAAVKSQWARADTRGNTLVEVSSKADSRPLCALDQGMIYDRTDRRAGGTTHEGELILPWSQTTYGLPAGLLGINCGHETYDYIDGFSEKTFKDDIPSETITSNYADKVQSRYNERQIRQWKMKADVYGTAGLNRYQNIANSKVSGWQAIQRDHISSTGLSRKYGREQI